MSSKNLQEKLVKLQHEKDAILKQIEDIKADKVKKCRDTVSFFQIIEPVPVDPEIRDLQLKAFGLKEQIEKVSIQLLKKGKLTNLNKAQGRQ